MPAQANTVGMHPFLVAVATVIKELAAEDGQEFQAALPAILAELGFPAAGIPLFVAIAKRRSI